MMSTLDSSALDGAELDSSLPREWQALGFTPGLSLRVFGMRRSGNHAILSWLQRNAPAGGSVFLNNCKPGTDPLQNSRGIELNGAHASQNKARRDMTSVTVRQLMARYYWSPMRTPARRSLVFRVRSRAALMRGCFPTIS
ncbi:hypothetical protein [Pseudophaeobacter leonis]|uniref:hypothetical protein n=1 Tax=Pseudophaeobacter leonis TaxID=1144477 RepID=UPI001F4EEB6E|nr:hypothetical protein [Pseudophaeobacter leonis]